MRNAERITWGGVAGVSLAVVSTLARIGIGAEPASAAPHHFGSTSECGLAITSNRGVNIVKYLNIEAQVLYAESGHNLTTEESKTVAGTISGEVVHALLKGELREAFAETDGQKIVVCIDPDDLHWAYIGLPKEA